MQTKGIKEHDLKIKYSEELEELRRQLKDKDKILDSYRKEHGKLENFFRPVREQIVPITPIKQVFQGQKESKVESPCVICAQISDGHLGEIQQPSEIENFNEYNVEICTERQMNYMHKILNWTELHRHSYTINEIAVLVTGDLIAGDIHDELKITSAFPSPVQCVEAGKLLAQQMMLLAPHFKKVTIHFIVEDNHARLTRKPQSKEAGMNSFNYVVGEIAKAYLKHHKNVEFNIYPQLEKVVNVNGRQYLICHGHNARGWMGIPWYGIQRQASKESMARMSEIMKDFQRAKEIGFHKYILGHWHTPFNFPLYSGCGSVSGTSTYDHKEGRHSEPSQSAWCVHPKHGEFDRTDFKL